MYLVSYNIDLRLLSSNLFPVEPDERKSRFPNLSASLTHLRFSFLQPIEKTIRIDS